MFQMINKYTGTVTCASKQNYVPLLNLRISVWAAAMRAIGMREAGHVSECTPYAAKKSIDLHAQKDKYLEMSRTSHVLRC
jgi:hypothetical protein